jgi:hypothetical protein
MLLALGDERPPRAASDELAQTRRAIERLSPFWEL